MMAAISFRRLKAEAERLHEDGVDDDAAAGPDDQDSAPPKLRSVCYRKNRTDLSFP